MARRDGRSGYLGSSADGDPSGFRNGPLPKAVGGLMPRSWPAECNICGDILGNPREKQTHFRNEHPA
jgi:hypothetical protein